MKGKHSQNKFVRFITLPIRFLGKARDSYVRSLANCAQGINYSSGMGGVPAGKFTSLPKSFSARSSRSDEGEDYSELIRAASVRSAGHVNEVDMFLQETLKQRLATMGSKGFPKSTSVGMGFMGRIEEERPGDISDQDSVHAKSELYPRSRSVAVPNSTAAAF
ncbi:3-isopropylmalate dehydratase large subunit like [Melia azedarach]|uniref:3-isopropylmalate dehydratase large subunit like n=1 Tax=Melia azedarach TaxID=155640 RepID=A0ACC1WRS6_MELAZ|nr:3-isopropylmalate dehydratase large subunit like [Melia azedarach]